MVLGFKKSEGLGTDFYPDILCLLRPFSLDVKSHSVSFVGEERPSSADDSAQNAKAGEMCDSTLCKQEQLFPFKILYTRAVEQSNQ